jgi:hypothetical protein
MRAGAAALTLTAAVACGKSEAERRAEEAARQMEEAAKKVQQAARQGGGSAEEVARGMEEMARGLAGAAGALGGGEGKAAEPVAFRDLMTLLPSLDGWERSEPEGERMTAPMAYAIASARYTRGEAKIDLKLTDSALHQVLLLPYALITSGGFERETSTGYEKAVKVAGHPAMETWNGPDRRGELTVIVGKRFVVSATGSGVDSTRDLHALVGRIDLEKLQKLGS